MIHLINMPFASILRPSLGLGQIKAQLSEAGMDCKAFNLNIDFAKRIGMDNYELLALIKRYDSQVGEWLFSREAWGGSFGQDDDEFLELCGLDKAELYRISDPKKWLCNLRSEVVPAFLDECCERLLAAGDLEVVGFSSLYFQTVPSIALIRRLKKVRPSVRIACGGPCFHGEMGEELIEKVNDIDALSTGEADDVILPLFQALLKGEDPAGLQGILYRKADGSIDPGLPNRPVSSEALEQVPDPDYGEYFEEIEKIGLTDDVGWKKFCHLPFETSRGCWKGEKQHCAFCGFNQGMNFRKKSPGRVIKTLQGFVERYPVRRFHASDTIPPQSYFKDLFSILKENPQMKDVTLFWEPRTTLNRDQVRLLAEAGICFIQPGVESLSTNILKCMRKGVTAIKNIRFLKLCQTFGIRALWNFMIRIPGERKEDYENMEALIPKIIHLTPPFGGAREVEMQRFSPYFTEPGRWADNIRPRPWYSGLYPEDRMDLSKVAYFFDADWKNTLGDGAYDRITKMIDLWVDIWQKSPKLPRLAYKRLDSGGLLVTDTRRTARSGRWELDRQEALIYMGIEDSTTPSRLKQKLGNKVGALEAVEATLRQFVAMDLAIEESGLYLGLAFPDNTPELAFSFRRKEVRVDVNSCVSIF